MKKILLTLLLFGISLSCYTQKCYVDKRGERGVLYEVASNNEVYAITAQDDNATSLKIPSKVDLYDWNPETQKYDIYVGTYTVTGIGSARPGVAGGFEYLQSISLPSTIKYIKTDAFWACEKLTTITIPNKVKEIEKHAFYGCTKLKKVYFTCNSKLETIGDGAFSECTSLHSINFPSTLKAIDQYAFHECSSLTSLVFPKNLEAIEENAFHGCTNIEKIHSYVSYPFKIDYSVFENSVFSNARLYLEDSDIAERYKNQQYWHQFKHVVYPHHTTQIYIYNIKSEGKGTTVVEEYETEMDLGAGASWLQYFNGCTVYNEEVKIEIPHFPGTGVPFVFIPDEGYILKQVLYASEKDGELVDVTSDLKYEQGKGYTYRTTDKGSHPTLIATFAKDVQSLLKDDKNIMQDNITFVKQSGNSIAITDGVDATKRYEIPSAIESDGVEYHVNAIASEAFKDNEALTEVFIPKSVESIGESAFDGCINLESIYCNKKEPIALGGKSKTRSSDGDEENVILTVFSGVDKKTCFLYVPKGSAEKYRQTDGWKDFQNIVEMNFDTLGDANGDSEIDESDIETVVNYIIKGETKNFIFNNADVDGNGQVNVVDLVKVVNMIKNKASKDVNT